MDSPEADGLVGMVVDTVSVTVEAGKVREFALATRTEDDVHLDAAAARAAGFPEVAATATHLVVAGHQRDQRAFVGKLGLAIERIVVGSVDWEFHRPLVATDRLTGTRRVVEDALRTGKRGGSMRLVTLETKWVDEANRTAVTQHEVLIERGAQ